MFLNIDLVLFWIALSSLLHVQGLSIDTTTIPESITNTPGNLAQNTTKDDEARRAQEPPLIFPSDPGQYKVLELNDASSNNETAIKILLSKVRQEHGEEVEPENTVTKELDKLVTISTTPKPAHVEPTESDVEEVDENLKNEVEEIQKPEEEAGLEELYHKQASSNLQVNQEFAEDIETNSNNLHGGHITAIFAGVLAVVCIAIYVGLISWRSYLEKRYGMREQLVTEDDYYNNNDIRHFAL
ncbi:uncharacterized protein LOC119651970 isoform X2 [Hermetia illucens]|uniref:uncharacterized protein LOC119651970 isoform X2 n=1 Tax=Hermetia illucens TaxID=343691 RepID=UPI0018CC1F1D|nr:uncharacterized protein LOC119651970 isoform X2 [Hermetia illucens]